MLIGYMRPYEEDYSCENQFKTLTKENCTNIISEEHSSSKERVQLEIILNNIRKGDKLVVSKLFSLADSTRHLLEILETLNIKGAYFKAITEEIDTSSSMGYDFTSIVKHLLQFQSDVISEKTKKGLYEAKQKGVSTGRPRKSDENIKRAIVMYESKKYSLAEIKAETGISKSTLYRYLEH